MSVIEVSDSRLNDDFYTQNPDFDILKFDLLDDNQVSDLNVEPETIDILKQYQRLLRIYPDVEIAKRLLDLSESQVDDAERTGQDGSTPSPTFLLGNPLNTDFDAILLDSAQAIASLTEAQFVSLLPGNEGVAKEMYHNAVDIKAKTQFLWANMKDTVASPHYRLMRASTVQESDRDALQRDFPNYQEMFGDLDYIDCEHCGSIFSPAAYFVDLMRLVEQYITIPNQGSIEAANGQTLNQRRPDLADIELTCENTNTPIPSLQIINGILEKRIGLQELATAKYPFNLPLNFPLEQIRSYLGHLKTDLATIYQTFDVNNLFVAREYLRLSPEEYNLIIRPETDSEKLKELYGLESAPGSITDETYLLQTGLSATEITDLLKQDLHFLKAQNSAGDRTIDTASNQTTNPIEGLIGHWTMNEIRQDSSGTRLIGSVDNKDGTLKGNATLESVADFPFRIVRNRRVLKLRGNGDRVSLEEHPELGFEGTKPYTMAAWIKPEAAGIIISKFNLSGSRSYFIKVQGDGKILAYRHVNPFTLLSDRTITFGKWSHVAVTYDGSTLKIYLDGQLAGSKDFGSIIANDNTTSVLIGALQDSGQARDFYQGQIAELRIWEKALNDSEIRVSGLSDLQPSEQIPPETSEDDESISLNLDRTNRFIRLAKKLDWSFADLDWVITSIQAREIDAEVIQQIAKIKQIQTKYKLPLDILCSFWYRMKTTGKGSNLEQPQDLFNRIFNNPFQEIFGDKFEDNLLPDDNKQIDLNTLEGNVEIDPLEGNVEIDPVISRICAALRLNVNQFIEIFKAIWAKEATVKLTVENLSQLFRTSQILRLLGLNIREYQLLLGFLGTYEVAYISIDLFIEIVELAEWIKQSKFKIGELDYIINNRPSSYLNLGFSADAIAEELKSLWQLAADSLLKPSDFVGEAIDSEQALVIFNKLLEQNLIEEVTRDYEYFLDASLEERSALVLDRAISIDKTSLKETIDESLDDEELQRLSEILETVHNQQKEELTQIADFLSVEAGLVLSLLDFTSISTQKPDYVSLLLTPLQAATQSSEIIQFFRPLSKILLVTKKLALTPAELKCITNNQAAFAIEDLSQLSLADIQAIARFKKLVAAFGDSEDKLVTYFAGIQADNNTNSPTSNADKLAELTGWKSTQIQLLVSPSDNDAANPTFDLGSNLEKTVTGITKLQNCFNLSRHLGVNISWLLKLIKLHDLTVTQEDNVNWEVYQDVARAVKEITKAKYDEAEWGKVREKIEGEANESKRNVLTAWIIWKEEYQNLRDLSQDLLIDVETSSCASVSIIKEATLAIQTYLHRCRMGLEPGVNKLDQIPEVWWQWIMNYRVWEANRKVFLYPENYLDPSLRKIKTPIYQELEEELLQSEITQESVEKAYQNYFEKFEEIAQLKPAGGYRCTVQNASGEQDTLYLFGRTATDPYTYYYRECIVPEANKLTWNPWQKIDLVINSKYINATYAFNKLFIFWVEIVKLEKNDGKEIKATIKYSYQKLSKQWIQPQTLEQDIVIEEDKLLYGNSNLWRKVHALPVPGDNSESEKILIAFGDLNRNNEFYKVPNNQGILLSIDLLQEKTSAIFKHQTSTAEKSILPVAHIVGDTALGIIATDNVLYDNYADYADDSNRGKNRAVAYWQMSETQTTITDYANHPNYNSPGIVRGNPQWLEVTDFPGYDFRKRKVLQLDGEGDYVEIEGGSNSVGNFTTINFTIRISFKTTASSGRLIGAGETRYDFWAIYLEDGYAMFGFSTGDTSGQPAKSSNRVNDNEWHNLMVVREGGQFGKLFIDNELVGQTNYSTNKWNSIDTPQNIFIGKNHSNGDYFKGQIAEVSISHTALSNNNIKLIENISSSNVSVSAVENQAGWFTFDNGDEAFLVIPQKKNDRDIQESPYKQIDRYLKVDTDDNLIELSYDASDFPSLSELNFVFIRLTTTTIRQLNDKMLIGGLDNLLTLNSQFTPELDFNRFSPPDFVIPPNSQKLDFEGPLGIYFWELFFHIPFLVANTLNSNQRFAEAQQWYHYIFNPTFQLSDNDKGLLGYWAMDEGNGTVIGDRTGNNDGTLTGQAEWLTVNDFGAESRKVLKFNGTDNYIDCGNIDFARNDYVIEAWFKTSTQNHVTIFTATKDKKHGIVIEILGHDEGKLRFLHRQPLGQSGSTGDLSTDANEKYNDGKWHYIEAIKNNDRMLLYVDGSLKGEKSGISNFSESLDVVIGKLGKNLSARFFNGQIAEVKISNVSAEQIFDRFSQNPSDRFWRFLPFRGNVLQKLPDILSNDSAIAAYKNNPFDPHAIARLRLGAYEKAIVMKYIDNILDWGDQLFAQDNRESINQATLLYFLAYDLLGEEPENLGKRETSTPTTFGQISGNNIPEFLINLEHQVKDSTPSEIVSTTAGAPFNDLDSYFCAPENEQFNAYWERVQDRLYKIRYCMNIEGVKRQLALFQPAIDPAQLVRAVAGGRTPLSVVAQLTPAVPHYRFDYMLERARNVTSTLIQLGSSLLSALEKKDAEEVALLRSSHEINILNLVTTTKEKQIEEAKETLASFEESLESAKERFNYYDKLTKEGWLQNENNSVRLMRAAVSFQTLAIPIHGLSVAAYLFPNTFGLANGGMQFGDAVKAGALIADSSASLMSTGSTLADKNSIYERRDQEWNFQKSLSEIDKQQIKAQIEAQKIRQDIAEQELTVHQRSIEQAKEIEDFLKDKFTNKELYQWMVGRLSTLYYQTYKVALDLAMATQSAYQYELNKNDTHIALDYWDSLKKGLLAGEGLMLGLNQLEKAYIEGNVRRFEIEKTISLLQLNPLAFQTLKNTGKCEFKLDEKLFDFDFPGHYCRQIKTIAVSIPAVVSPYQNISATLTQTKNETLLKPDVGAVSYLLGEEVDPPDNSVLRSNWRRNQKIAISRGAMDNGLFELNFYWDTRYLPFEGTGAVSSWELSLPKQTNRIDFDTISDVIITLSYTALDGGDVFRKKVTELEPLQNYTEAHYFNLKQAFPGEWHSFINSQTNTDSQQFSFNISSEIIPLHIENAELIEIILKLDSLDVSSTRSFLNLEIADEQPREINFQSNNIAILDVNLSMEQFASNWRINFDLTNVPENLKQNGFLNAEVVNNIELILAYKGEINWGN